MPEEKVIAPMTGPEDRGILDRDAPPPNATWAYGSDPSQVADVYLPSLPRPGAATVILIHGGFWRPGYDRIHLRPMAAALAQEGYAVLLLEYRRWPGDPDATVADIRTAAHRAREALPAQASDAGLPATVVGHSAGGHLALWLVSQPDVAVDSCVALAPVADLAEAERLDLDGGAVGAFLGAGARDRPDLDPVRLSTAGPAVTVIHGARDSLVPIEMSRSYCRRGARLVELDDCAHFELIDPSSHAWPAFLHELSRSTGDDVARDAAIATAEARTGIE